MAMKTYIALTIYLLKSIICNVDAWAVLPYSMNTENNSKFRFRSITAAKGSQFQQHQSGRHRHDFKMASQNAEMGPGGGRQTKKQVEEMLNFINEPVTESVDQTKVQPGPPSDDDLAPLVKVIAKAADMRKAEDIVAMRIAKLSTMAGFVVICSGNSRPQNQAIAASIKDDVEEEFGGENSLLGNGVPEGTADSGWILLDYGDVMVHIMTPKSRLFYDIEGQWREKGGEYMDLSDVLLPNKAMMGEASPQAGGSMGGISEEDDPFWS